MHGPDHALNHTMRTIIGKSVTDLQLLLRGIPLLLRENHPGLQEIPLGTLLAFLPVAFSFLLPPAVEKWKEKERKRKKDNRRALWNTNAQWLLLSTVKLDAPQPNANSASKQSSNSHLPCFFLCLPGSFTDHREENEQRKKMVNHNLRAGVLTSEETKCRRKKNEYYYHFVGHCGAFCGLKWRIWRAKMYFSPLK